MDVDRVRAEVAQVARVLHRLGYLDLLGHVSVRLGDDVVVITPEPGSMVPPPARMAAFDAVVVARDGRRLHGSHAPPRELPLHLAIYDRRPRAGAIVCASPPTSIAFGMVGRPVLPLTHSQAWLAHQGAASIRVPGFVSSADRAAEVVGIMADHPVCHLPGMSTVFVADSLIEALRYCDTYEYLAEVNLIADSLTDRPRVVDLARAEAIRAERSGGETVPSRDPVRYYASLDDPGALDRPTFQERHGGDDPVGRLKSKVATACRMLAARGTLVGFFEHVSHRLPGGGRFLMSPAKNFADMEPDDVGVIGMEGDCAWLEGPYPPAPFRRYHRDLFKARPDVQAIVHTHEMYGRAFVMSERPLEPVWRNGTEHARPISVFDRPSMVFSSQDRSGAVEALRDDSVLHVLSHGTDYLAGDLEEATVAAIHREQAYVTYHLALRLGEPKSLAPEAIEEIRCFAPAPAEWWRYYGALL